MPKKTTITDFIKRANIKHNNFYVYDDSVYINTHTKLTITCPNHGQFEQLPMDHLRGSGCKICADLSRRQHMKEKYGVEYASQSTELVEKRKRTNSERYGVDSPAQSMDIRLKMKQTNLERYGVEYPISLLFFKEKRIKNNIEKYGLDSISKLVEVKERKRHNNIEKYGIKHHHQSKMVDVLPLIEDYDWLFEQYIIFNKSSDMIANELNIGSTTVLRYLHSHEISIKQSVGYSCRCISWLNSISEQEGINIQHALNGGEYQIPGTKYSADGYCRETNTIYEFHGDYWHGNPEIYESDVVNESTNCLMGELYEKTIKREQEIRSMGYNLVVMWENDYMGNKI